MTHFYPLTAIDISHDTPDAVVLTLAPRPDDAGHFQFLPGQHLVFKRAFDGEEIRRSYSICTSPDEGVLKVGIKRAEGGVFSSFANRELAVGDVLEAMPPQGRFHAPEKMEGKHYLGFAAGSGITPILSIAKAILKGDAKARFTLVYGNRSVNQIMFREELGALKDVYLDRFSVVHILSGGAQEIELFSGRITREKCGELFQHWVDPKDAEMAFICGPESMTKDVTSALEDAGMEKNRIHFELFGIEQIGRMAKPVEGPAARDAKDPVRATIIIDGTPHTFVMERGQSVLEAARAQKLDAPFSCRAGVCSTCMARVISGEVEMAQNHALEDHEIERGYVLTCQSRPVSDAITIEYEGH